MRGEDSEIQFARMPQAETPPRAWGIQRDFITFLSAPTIFTLVSNTVQAAENVAGIHSGSPAQGQNTLPPGRVTPPPLAADAAMSRARRRSRTPAGRTERQSRRGHRPGHRPGKVRADAPRDTRRAGYSPIKETIFESPPSGEYGGAGGVEGSSPLTPCPAPGRRPAAHAGQQPLDKRFQKTKASGLCGRPSPAPGHRALRYPP